MKRTLLLLFAISMLTSMLFAQVGLTVGAGIQIADFGADDLDPVIIIPKVIYEKEINEQFEIYAEANHYVPTADGADGNLDLEVELTYNINENFSFFGKYNLDMSFADDADPEMYFTPGARYKLEGGMDMFFRLDLPLYLGTSGDALDTIGLDFTYSLMRLRDKRDMADTWGAELRLEMFISDAADEFSMNCLKITPYYETGLLYGELEINLPLVEDGMKTIGMTITPKVECNIPPVPGLGVWLDLPISNIGADDLDVAIGLEFGVKYSF